MRAVIVMLACVGASLAQAQSVGSCQLVSEDKFARVWQCQPTPPPDTTSIK
jgi:hypothetical protein